MFKRQNDVTKLDGRNILQVGKKISSTKDIEEFYTKNPFPNYDEVESMLELSEKVNKNEFIKNFKKFFDFGHKIIEVGSGTSQLSMVLAHGTNNEVVAFDPTLASLKLGSVFAEDNNILNCKFVNGDIYDDPFLDDYFDLVWCSGVLHHTKTPEAGFDIISSWVKPEGYIVVGLYNKYGRLRTGFRQLLFKLLRGGDLAVKIVSIFDPVLRLNKKGSSKSKAWIQDQYEHPIETWHTLDEVISWFNNNNIEFVSSIPGTSFEPIDFNKMFENQGKGSIFSRLVQQLLMLFSSSGREGGLFLVIGRKLKG